MSELRRRLVVSVAMAIGLIAVACSVPTDAEPDTLALDPEFAELLEAAPSTEATTTTAPPLTRNMSLYFIVDDKLALALTPISVSRADDLTAVLNELAGGTRLENHRNAIPPGVTVASTSIDSARGIATISLADNTLFTAVESREQLRAIAQFVFTATAAGNRFGVTAVQFEIDGNLRAVPTDRGSDKSEPVNRCDYAELWPDPIPGCPSATTTTTTTPPQTQPSDPNGF
jgi:hypothetical protein